LPQKLAFNFVLVNSLQSVKKLDTEKDAWPDLRRTFALKDGVDFVDTMHRVTEMLRYALPDVITQQDADLFGVKAGPVVEKDKVAYPELTFKVVPSGKGQPIVLGGAMGGAEIFQKLFGFARPGTGRKRKARVVYSDGSEEEVEERVDTAPIKPNTPLFVVQITAAAKPRKGAGGGGADKPGKTEKPFTVSLLVKHPTHVDTEPHANAFVSDNKDALGALIVLTYDDVKELRLEAVTRPEDDEEDLAASTARINSTHGLSRKMMKIVEQAYLALNVKESTFFSRLGPLCRLVVGCGHNVLPRPYSLLSCPLPWRIFPAVFCAAAFSFCSDRDLCHKQWYLRPGVCEACVSWCVVGWVLKTNALASSRFPSCT
jgi:hypothetical protein